MPQGLIAVISAVGTVAQVVQQRKAAKARAAATALQQKQQQLAARRSRVQAVRASQIARAQAVASAGAAGSFSSSGAAGGIGGLSSRTGSDLGYSTQMSGLSRDITGHLQSAAKYEGQGALWGALGNFAGNTLGGFQTIYGKMNQTVNRPPQQSTQSLLAPTYSLRPQARPV